MAAPPGFSSSIVPPSRRTAARACDIAPRTPAAPRPEDLCSKRTGEFIILTLGESVVAIGVGAAEQPISAPLLLAAILGVAAAVGLWWLYFDVASLAAAHSPSQGS